MAKEVLAHVATQARLQEGEVALAEALAHPAVGWEQVGGLALRPRVHGRRVAAAVPLVCHRC